jgi:hypothetical protein
MTTHFGCTRLPSGLSSKSGSRRTTLVAASSDHDQRSRYPNQRHRRLAFWGTLALMRCVGSSPAAAASALRNRLAADPDRLEEQVLDDDADEADAVDVEPASGLEQDGPLATLVAQAEQLAKKPDPKLDAVTKTLKPLITDGANPVVFCRFIATAEHVADGLRKAFPKLRIETVTGELTPEETRARVEHLPQVTERHPTTV